MSIKQTTLCHQNTSNSKSINICEKKCAVTDQRQESTKGNNGSNRKSDGKMSLKEKFKLCLLSHLGTPAQHTQAHPVHMLKCPWTNFRTGAVWCAYLQDA